MQVSAPTISVPDLANCTVQLQVQADRTLYDRSDYISVTARFSTQGDCAMLHTPTGWAAGFAFYMFSIQIVNQSGEMAPLTAEGQWWREDFAFKLFENGKWFRGEQPLPPGETRCYRLPLDRWYDLAAPGTYTLTLEYRGVTEMNPEGVIGNPVIFTRRP